LKPKGRSLSAERSVQRPGGADVERTRSRDRANLGRSTPSPPTQPTYRTSVGKSGA